MPDDVLVRALVAEGWAPGDRGAGLVLTDRKLLTWRNLVWGGPHHYDVLQRGTRDFSAARWSRVPRWLSGVRGRRARSFWIPRRTSWPVPSGSIRGREARWLMFVAPGGAALEGRNLAE